MYVCSFEKSEHIGHQPYFMCDEPSNGRNVYIRVVDFCVCVRGS